MWTAVLLVFVDQMLKAVSLNYMRAWGTNGVYVFDWNKYAPMYSSLIGLLVVALVCGFLIRPVISGSTNISWPLILAGLVSNFIDGVRWYAVIDYIRLPGTFFCFNLADCCILAGALLLAWGAIWPQKRERHIKRA